MAIRTLKAMPDDGEDRVQYQLFLTGGDVAAKLITADPDQCRHDDPIEHLDALGLVQRMGENFSRLLFVAREQALIEGDMRLERRFIA
jgi:hypothetical protein